MKKCTYCEANALVTYCKACGTIAPDTADGRLKQAAPALLAVLTEPLTDSPSDSFADDLETIAGHLEGRPVYADKIRAKAKAIRAAIAEARGEAG